jgi:hypothetical protein
MRAKSERMAPPQGAGGELSDAGVPHLTLCSGVESGYTEVALESPRSSHAAKPLYILDAGSAQLECGSCLSGSYGQGSAERCAYGCSSSCSIRLPHRSSPCGKPSRQGIHPAYGANGYCKAPPAPAFSTGCSKPSRREGSSRTADFFRRPISQARPGGSSRSSCCG